MASWTDAAHSSLMTWDLTGQGFRMRLDPEVPAVLEQNVEAVVSDLLEMHDLDGDDVRAWAIHPGGPAILDVIGDRLGLGENDLRPSRAVLAEHGNCSSATVLLVLDRVRRDCELATATTLSRWPSGRD